MTTEEEIQRIESKVLQSIIIKPLIGYKIFILVCVFFVSLGLFFWIKQITLGLGVTGLNTPVFWGVYIVNFVFFIGISHAGTLISSILRITDTQWRTPFTRMAEAITVFSLPFGVGSVVIDLGRPDRLLHTLNFPHLTSPIIWDVLSISTYLITSCLYFYLALVPDIALCRDILKTVSPFKQKVYKTLSLGWQGTPKDWKTLNKILTGMSIFLFALVISVHTNVSFVFGMTLKPGWHTAVIGPYFVLGAIYSGVATVIVVMAILRRVYSLEEIVREEHFQKIGKFLLTLCCFWFYFTVVEVLTTFYGGEAAHMIVFKAKFFEEYAFIFWLMFVLNFIIPFAVLSNFFSLIKLRTIQNMVIVSIIIDIGMWLERYSIIVPSGARPYLPWQTGHYLPTLTEWSITLMLLFGFFLLLGVFIKFFPIITLWELKESVHTSNPNKSEKN